MPDFRRATLQDFIDFLASQPKEVRMLPLEYVDVSFLYVPLADGVLVDPDEDGVSVVDR